jgi:hypothetical protein
VPPVNPGWKFTLMKMKTAEAVFKRLDASQPSLRANGARECAPDDRLREAIDGSG